MLHERSALLGTSATAALRTIRTRFETRDQQQVDYLDGIIQESDADGSTPWCYRQHLGMLDWKRSAIRKVEIESLERPSLMHLA